MRSALRDGTSSLVESSGNSKGERCGDGRADSRKWQGGFGPRACAQGFRAECVTLDALCALQDYHCWMTTTCARPVWRRTHQVGGMPAVRCFNACVIRLRSGLPRCGSGGDGATKWLAPTRPCPSCLLLLQRIPRSSQNARITSTCRAFTPGLSAARRARSVIGTWYSRSFCEVGCRRWCPCVARESRHGSLYIPCWMGCECCGSMDPVWHPAVGPPVVGWIVHRGFADAGPWIVRHRWASYMFRSFTNAPRASQHRIRHACKFAAPLPVRALSGS